MTEKQKEKIISLRKSGISYAAIAENLGLSKDAVKSFCRRNTVSNNHQSTVVATVFPNVANNTCRNCGTPIIQPDHVRKKLFCSAECRKSWWKSNPTPQGVSIKNQRTCQHCGTIFAVYGKSMRRYCSHACYINARFRKDDACE